MSSPIHKLREDATNFTIWLFKALDVNVLQLFMKTTQNVANAKTKSALVDLVNNLGKDCSPNLKLLTVQLINLLVSKAQSD